MSNGWEALVESTGVPVAGIRRVLAEWFSRDPTDQVSDLNRLVRGLEQEWPTRIDQIQRLRLGVYSPIQLLVWRCANARRVEIEYEYPFLFSLMGSLTATLLGERKESKPKRKWPRSA